MDINLNADPDFREMVRAEVKAALISDTKVDVAKAVQEGIRRAVGNADVKIPGYINSAVKETLPSGHIRDMVRQAVRDLIREQLTIEIKTLAEAEVKKIDVAAEVRKKLANLHVSIIL